MTNLQRWLTYLLLFLVPYFGILFATIKTSGKEKNILITMQLLPYALVIMFGIYAAGTVLYRTFTFNDCPEAAKELQEQILEARQDLLARGFNFRE